MTLKTILDTEKLAKLKNLLIQAVESTSGEIWECGVYLGGSASVITKTLEIHKIDRKIRLFDSFQGLPKPNEHDNHHIEGDFSITEDAEESIREYFKSYTNVSIHKGWIPDSFVGLEDSVISFCHLDLDLYEGYIKTLEFVWPRMPPGGIIVFDDYDAWSCLGAKKAIDEFIEKNNIELQQQYWIRKT